MGTRKKNRMILLRWCYHLSVRFVITCIGILIFITYSSQILYMNINQIGLKNNFNRDSFICISSTDKDYNLKKYKINLINNISNYDVNIKYYNVNESMSYDKYRKTKSSSCQELFTTPLLKKLVKDKLEYQKSLKEHCALHSWKSIRNIMETDNPPFTYAPYEALAWTLQPLLTEKLENINTTPKILEYLPWLKCGLRQYGSRLSEQCALGHRTPRIMLLGDSRVRGLALQLLENWKHLNLTVTTQKGSLPYIDYKKIFYHPEKVDPGLIWLGADTKARTNFVKHSDIQVTTSLAPKLSVQYVFSGFLAEDQLFGDLLKPSIVQVLRDQRNTPAHSLPTLMVIGTGTWAINGDKFIRDTVPHIPELLRNLDWLMESITLTDTEIRGALQQLREKGVTVVWMLQDMAKYNVVDWNRLFEVPTYEFFFEWINEILLNTLINYQDQGLVTIWDSNLVISTKVIRTCRQLLRSGTESGWDLGTSREWGCGDIIHSGPQAEHRYAQILLNYMCNDEHQLCCGDKNEAFFHYHV